MEVYFKDLISEKASLEKLVDDIAAVVHGADDFANTVGENIPEQSREEVRTRLDRLKESYGRFRAHAVDSARATDRLLRRNPYTMAGAALLVGILIGTLCARKGRGADED